MYSQVCSQSIIHISSNRSKTQTKKCINSLYLYFQVCNQSFIHISLNLKPFPNVCNAINHSSTSIKIETETKPNNVVIVCIPICAINHSSTYHKIDLKHKLIHSILVFPSVQSIFHPHLSKILNPSQTINLLFVFLNVCNQSFILVS